MAPNVVRLHEARFGMAERLACENLVVGPGQEAFVISVAAYLERCDRPDDPWTPFAITVDGTVVGFVMTALDPDDGYLCIGGLTINATQQRRGYGRAAVSAIIESARAQQHVGVGLAYHPDNYAAIALYRDLGFQETGETDDDEVIMVLRLRSATD